MLNASREFQRSDVVNGNFKVSLKSRGCSTAITAEPFHHVHPSPDEEKLLGTRGVAVYPRSILDSAFRSHVVPLMVWDSPLDSCDREQISFKSRH